MSRVQMLRAVVEQRLTAAVEEIFVLVERTITEYEEEVSRSKQENDRQRKLLEAVLNPEVWLHRADVQQLLVSEEVPPEQQQWRPSLDQDPEPPHIKEEQEELWSLEEADIIKFTFTPVPVKSEEEPQSSQLHQSQSEENREAEPRASTSADQMKPEADGDCGGSASNLDPASDLQPTSADRLLSPRCSEPETEDRDDDSGETEDSDDYSNESRGPQSDSSTLKNPYDLQLLGGHMRPHTGGKRFSCLICAEGFDYKGNMEVHMRLHTGEKLFSCSVCGRRCTRERDLKRHMRVHTGEKTFSCPVCKKSFSLKENLVQHMRIHTGEKIFSCSICGRRSSRERDLKKHMRIHTGEKPFSCSVCGKRFIEKGNLNKHMRVHTGNKPYICI